jgi:competence protein ComEC
MADCMAAVLSPTGSGATIIEPKRPRPPLVPVALAIGTGIFVDRCWSQPLAAWICTAVLCVLACGVAAVWRRSSLRLTAGLLLCSIACLGGARHHLFWSTAAPDDLSLFAGDEPKLVRLVGTVVEQPEVITPFVRASRSAWAQHDTTATTLACRRMVSEGKELSVSGRAALRVKGALADVNVGDEIEVCGWLVRPQPARNPGAFDAVDFYRRQGIRCLVTADHPEAVRQIRPGSPYSLSRIAARLRNRAQAQFNRDLSSRNAPVAAALMFGGRMGMDEEIREAFAQSGTLHVLAISGTHVAILAILLWGVCRLLGLSTRATALAIIAGVVAYTFLTDCRPPVIRATLLVSLFGSAGLLYRRPSLSSGLALAAIIILLWNPSDLFDVGAQLSFLGVLAVAWAARAIARIERRPTVEKILRSHARPTIVASARSKLWKLTWESALVSLAAALFTMPLIAARFHMVSPIGVVVNLVLAPFSTLLLWTGYLHTAMALVFGSFSRYFAVPFDGLLTAFVGLVERAAHVRFSHAYVPGPPDWWLGGYYVVLLAAAFLDPFRRWGMRRWSLLAAWMIVGLAWGLRPADHEQLRCTFLSVGHGCAILVEMPSGRTLLYDAGSMQDGRIAERAVQATLWEQRCAGLDAIVISHADVDHFNGVAGLMQSVPVGKLFVSQQFLDFRQPAVKAVCESSFDCGVPMEVVCQGDCLRLDERVTMRVLHPGFGPPHSDDNANSIVLAIEFASRRILLTGDLDGSGQAALLQQTPLHVDVLLSPHHGSRKANPESLAKWATPGHLIVSADRRVDFKSLRSAYGPDCEIVSTHELGAITFEIAGDGSMRRTCVLTKKNDGPPARHSASQHEASTASLSP